MKAYLIPFHPGHSVVALQSERAEGSAVAPTARTTVFCSLMVTTHKIVEEYLVPTRDGTQRFTGRQVGDL